MAFRLSDEQWELVAPLVTHSKRLDGRGRPRQSDRYLLDAALFVLSHRSFKWRNLKYQDDEYPPFQSCYRRFQEWLTLGVFDHVVETLARDMEERGGLPLRDCFFDDVFVAASRKSYFQFIDDHEEYKRPWPIRTKYFFESPSIWERFFITTKSPWIQARLPNDLRKRARRI